ncbi:hypothetical protein JAAARDRAFT_54011 [Jaapia argillacea MUCL 33604]|uniref:DH domain-containing protein n=1 Tax=Jaapia argillacea MUCL 33604 TaxID=933084 RepID=A0A067Q9U1_9AGAM|nr:hypothetical protein JAAARDRAFT_54011 [Jaapia argillacea MUCL 33604]
MNERPLAPTPSASPPLSPDDTWPSDYSQDFIAPPAEYPYAVNSPVSILVPPDSATLPGSHSPFVRPASYSDDSSVLDANIARSLALPTKLPILPDPSQFPDPYPFRRPYRLNSPSRGFSSGGSSSASTRSSAYTSSGSALTSSDYGHLRIASDEDETSVGVGVTADEPVQLVAQDPNVSCASSATPSHTSTDQTRWSYTGSVRSRSSSIGNSSGNLVQVTENAHPRLHSKPSFDNSWQPVDEREEFGLTTDDETDDDVVLDEDHDGLDDDDTHEEPTAAVVVVEEGRGLIVRGEGMNLSTLQVHPGTTHLLLGSSTSPNAMPSFLVSVLPPVTNTLLVLDLSANFLHALPPALGACGSLEELNIASNPLRALPVFIAHLSSLRVLIADSTGIGTLPDALNSLEKLHTLSVRRNRMHSLPSWLCLLPALQTLLVDTNPFQGPWKALVEPLLAKIPMTPMYPSSTPTFPLPSASLESTTDTDVDDLSDPSSPGDVRSHNVEEDTITPARAPTLGRALTAPPLPPPDLPPPPPRLSRTRTTPSKTFYDKNRPGTSYTTTNPPMSARSPPERVADSGYFGDNEVRKMKSAGDLRRAAQLPTPPVAVPDVPAVTPMRTLVHTSSSSNLAELNNSESSSSSMPKRYASLGVSSSATRGMSRSRPTLQSSLWDHPSPEEDESASHAPPSQDRRPLSPTRTRSDRPPNVDRDSRYTPGRQRDKDEKGSRWGFLKKMSMGKIKAEQTSSSRPPSRPTTSEGRSPAAPSVAGSLQSRPGSTANSPSSSPQPAPRLPPTPQIEMRISTAGSLDVLSGSHPFSLDKKPSLGALKVPQLSVPSGLSPPSGGLFPPTATTSRANKRRSFLPIDSPAALSIPPASTFVPGLSVANGTDECEDAKLTPTSVSEPAQRKEEERARDSYTRALRSVMSYLKDMYDLGLSQSNTVSVYAGVSPNDLSRRRPTLVDGGRALSEITVGSTASIASSGQLRSLESMSPSRAGSSVNTMSIMTNESGSASGEERKFKDDKGKRAMIVKEIVETERTYVKGLQELADIYIKPACAPANVLSGVGSGRETIVPAAERKIVFGGLDSLFSFHTESFLPALERAAAPIMHPSSVLSQIDRDGRLSFDVAKKVADTFVSHAAFMKMYSTYINNFDNSVQRIKHWTSSRSAAGASPSALSPSSSTAQLVGLGLAISAVTLPQGVLPDGTMNPAGVLSSGQRKRIKTYLKRCRVNPRHSQLNLEGYLLLPVQRIPRYKLLLEELARSTPPTSDFMDDPLDRALAEISSLATNMNEGKRESESRRKLVNWQSRIRGKFPSPLVQPHRRLIMDGPLLLTRVVRKAAVAFDVLDSNGDTASVQVDCLAPELTPRPLTGVLCNDLLVLCRDPSEGQDPNSQVDLWAVLRMQTLAQPCSIVHGNALRIVDNKAILYFDVPSPSDALNWFRAINLHIPASKA